MTVTVAETLDAATLAQVRAFCAASDGYSYLQDPDWVSIWPCAGRRHGYRHVILRRGDGSVAAYGVLRHTRLGGGYALGAFRRGPVTTAPGDLAPALREILPELRRQGYISVSVNPRWEDTSGDAVEAALDGLGAHVAAPNRQRLHSCTGLIDLAPQQDSIVAACNAHARRQLRKIDRLGLTTRDGDGPADRDRFERWLRAFCDDRGLDRRGLPPLAAQDRWIALRGGDNVVVEQDGAPVGAFTLLRDGPRLLNLSVAWADPRSSLPRSYIVYWYAIRRYGGQANGGGPRWLDHAGRSDPRVPRQDAGAAGRDRFKDGFPQRTVRLPRVHQFALRPVLWRAFETMERHLPRNAA